MEVILSRGMIVSAFWFLSVGLNLVTSLVVEEENR